MLRRCNAGAQASWPARVLVLVLALALPAPAQLRLPAVIGDHMVLQRDAQVPIWGWAPPGETVRVVPGWDSDAPVSAVAGADGAWRSSVKTPAAGGPFSITIAAGGASITVNDVLSGEVWLCSGQSNMEMPVAYAHRGYAGVKNWKEEVAAADFPRIRLFSVAKAASAAPVRDCKGAWVACSPATVGTFSGTAYFFGRDVHRALDVPVGLIQSAWGGTPAESWTSEEGLRDFPELAEPSAAVARARAAGESRPESRPASRPPNTPASLYNGMIAPLVPYAIRGAIWYQGESNRGRYLQYRSLFPAMIADWRRSFGVGDFPFYYVQIAPFEYRDAPGLSAGLREAQAMTMRVVPNTGMVATTDVGDPKDIHPKDKQEVGRRLALWALAKTYGRPVACAGPVYLSMTIEGDAVRVAFENAEGLVARGAALTAFEIAGEDRKFVAAEAAIRGPTVVVRSAAVARPVAVRFAHGDAPEPNLFNAAGLPAYPFRTDDWPLN
jgi:sialate O-acetylesterase